MSGYNVYQALILFKENSIIESRILATTTDDAYNKVIIAYNLKRATYIIRDMQTNQLTIFPFNRAPYDNKKEADNFMKFFESYNRWKMRSI